MRKVIDITKDLLVPVAVGLLPFLPAIYDYITEPDIYFVYEYKNEKSPVAEWNRTLTRMLSQVEKFEESAVEKIPDPLLKKIGEEIYKSLPAMLSGIGFSPMERSSVWIANVGGRELKNIRVHFLGCEGLDKFETAPDTLGSNLNQPIKELRGKNSVTLRYDKLPASIHGTDSLAVITYYGEETSNCQPQVEADVEGHPASGKRQSILEYQSEVKNAEVSAKRRADFFFKLFLAIGLIYIYFKVRRIEKKTP